MNTLLSFRISCPYFSILPYFRKSSNGSTVTEAAYKACEADAQKECEQETGILDLAQQNAENIVRALVDPFVKQLDSEYELKIGW